MSTQPADVPRDPSAYSPTLHFGERFRDRYDEMNRHLDGEIVAGCITEGNISPSGDDTVRFYQWFDGVEYCIVVDVSTRDVISGYPVTINNREATASDRWSSNQLTDIRTFIDARDPDDPSTR